MADTPQAPVSFLGRFTVLKGAARELWLVFAVKLLVIAAYARDELDPGALAFVGSGL